MMMHHAERLVPPTVVRGSTFCGEKHRHHENFPTSRPPRKILQTDISLPAVETDIKSLWSIMDVSRIFIRGLPPSLSESDFKKHFGSQGIITDSRLFSDRRIGYVGYKSPDEAHRAVKYFNRSFIKMSKIAVELARPVEESVSVKRQGYGKQGAFVQPSGDQQNNLKRKREAQEGTESTDPKLQEFLQVMQPRSKTKRTNDFQLAGPGNTPQATEAVVENDADASDGEYQSLQANMKPPKELGPSIKPRQPVSDILQSQNGVSAKTTSDEPPNSTDTIKASAPTSDADWLRSKTSRLLGLNDEETDAPENEDDRNYTDAEPATQNIHPQRTAQMQEDNPAHQPEEQQEETPTVDEIEQKIQASARLYLRNLSYAVTEDDLRTRFAEFGDLQEVRFLFISSFLFCLGMNTDRDNLCNAYAVNQ